MPGAAGVLDRVRRLVSSRQFDRNALVDRHATGRSFADIGCMWSVHGDIAFRAEAAGATHVTGVDLMAPTPAYLRQHEARRSAVRFVQGDVHDPATLAAVGEHDVVWCSGVIYHAPDPLHTLRALRSLTSETLLLGSEVIREAHRPRTAVFDPDPKLHPNIGARLDAAGGYSGWWWGLTPSALRAMCSAAGFDVVEEYGTRWYRLLVALPVDSASP